MNNEQNKTSKKHSPLILAPAGNRASFLAALAAGADAVYCGLKDFSARMEAKNFSLEELAVLTQMAHSRGVQVFITFNSLIKPDELSSAGKLMDQLNQCVKPDALIIQDLSMIQLARQTGFSGELHLSTLSNVSFSSALDMIKKNIPEVTRVVLPRELNIDEIKAVAAALPENLDLEVFIHGALCYGVSGRCYWSSFFGGKSGLRGRCVQPCRRIYSQNNTAKRYFSCQDLSLDVLVKVLMTIPEIKVWKIEGRKKSPHYVYYTVKAYKMMRDHGADPQMKKDALSLLDQSLGRTSTHYNFLPQRPQNPVNTENQTGSGLLVGTVKGSKDKPYLVPRQELLPGDVLRIGYEDQKWHSIDRVTRFVPEKGRLFLKFNAKRSGFKEIPVFLTDRREKALQEMITSLEADFDKIKLPEPVLSKFEPGLGFKNKQKNIPLFSLNISRDFIKKSSKKYHQGIWLCSNSIKNTPAAQVSNLWWILPPVIWPDDETLWNKLISDALKNGARNFILNQPWQITYFKQPESLNLWAGPFCNIANPAALSSFALWGYKGAVVSPELGKYDYLQLPAQSPLPLGIVISGLWPLCISRTLSDNIKTDQPFASPKKEESWVTKHESDFWVYPNWEFDIITYKDELQKAGFKMFVHFSEPVPQGINLKKRPGLWNWSLNLS
ncbi:Peptidase U32 domain-containing protein [Desulfonema limicola]|uniref:Peptidase U32 domain-containing protein n=1 Tax=Desulfonema limicola TaxID=45656 RepID=A0A975B5T1_9BACT|nr:peptidase U32 family protein [Desulfonema limicola]QTA79336.1 Peptidase U32 domain-containing protein [Desulfonema limicola]